MGTYDQTRREPCRHNFFHLSGVNGEEAGCLPDRLGLPLVRCGIRRRCLFLALLQPLHPAPCLRNLGERPLGSGGNAPRLGTTGF